MRESVGTPQSRQRDAGRTASEPGRVSGARAWWRLGPAADGRELAMTTGLTVICSVLGMLTPLATDMYMPALPQVVADFGSSASAVQWTITVFMIGMGLGQLFWGPVTDRYGRRRPLMVACVLLVVSSAVAAAATSVPMLIVARLIQAFTGSAGMTVGKALARDLSAGVRLAQVLSLLGVITGLAPILAPVIGGLLAAPIGWRGILAVIAAFSLAILVTAALGVPESLPAGRRHTGRQEALGASALRVVTDRLYVGYTLTQAFGSAALMAFVGGATTVIQEQYDLGPVQYAGVFAINGVFMMAGGFVNQRLVTHFDPHQILTGSVGVMLVAGVAAAAVSIVAGKPSLWLLMAMIVVLSLASGPSLANSTSLSLDRHGEDAGMAAAIQGFVQSLGQAGGTQAVAITGAVTAVSMTSVMGVSAILAAVSYVVFCRGAAPRPDHDVV